MRNQMDKFIEKPKNNASQVLFYHLFHFRLYINQNLFVHLSKYIYENRVYDLNMYK